ncbi:MAG: tyrosine-type recombinase/integrase [Gammaproteobacteria bacterium]
MLRHTIATLLLRNGVDIRVVQEFLGHASITTTQRYTHVDQNQLRKALGSHHPRKDLL